jgi:hypothetical protein
MWAHAVRQRHLASKELAANFRTAFGVRYKALTTNMGLGFSFLPNIRGFEGWPFQGAAALLNATRLCRSEGKAEDLSETAWTVRAWKLGLLASDPTPLVDPTPLHS